MKHKPYKPILAFVALIVIACWSWLPAQINNGGGSGGGGTTCGSPTCTVSTAGVGNGVLALSGNTSGTSTFTANAVAGTVGNPVVMSNALMFPVGAVALPAIRFNDTFTDGFYSSGANAVTWAQNGGANGVTLNGAKYQASNAGVFCWNSAAGDSTAACDTGLSRDAAGVVDAGTGAAQSSAGVVKAAAFRGGGAAATLTGTGACATFSGQLGGSSTGQSTCTAATAASTLTITPGTTAPNGWICHVQDETTRANLFQQTSHTTTACTLTITSVTQNDVFVFSAFQY